MVVEVPVLGHGCDDDQRGSNLQPDAERTHAESWYNAVAKAVTARLHRAHAAWLGRGARAPPMFHPGRNSGTKCAPPRPQDNEGELLGVLSRRQRQTHQERLPPPQLSPKPAIVPPTDVMEQNQVF